jgi:predicted phage-related endonuclease
MARPGLTDEQKRARLGKVTATRIAMVALGDEHPYGGARAAFIDAIGEAEEPAGPQAELMAMGNYLEPGILAAYADRTGQVVAPGRVMVHPTKEWAAATPDGIVVQAPGFVQAKHISRDAHLWGDEGFGVVPDLYRIQCAWEMAVAPGIEWDDLAPCIMGRLRIYRIARDTELEGYLWQIAEKFYRDHIVSRIPPPPDGTPASASWIRRRYPRDDGSIVTATPEVAQAVAEYDRARALENHCAHRKELTAQIIQEFMGNATAMAIPGQPHGVTWKARKSGGTDWKGLAAEAMEFMTPAHRRRLVEKFTRPGTRSLRVPNSQGEDDE